MTKVLSCYLATFVVAMGLIISSCAASMEDEGVIVVPGGESWPAVRNDGWQVFCGSMDCRLQIVVVSDNSEIWNIYVNGESFFSGSVEIAQHLGMCGREFEIVSLYYYKSNPARDPRYSAWGVDMQFTATSGGDAVRIDALLTISAEGTVSGSCVGSD